MEKATTNCKLFKKKKSKFWIKRVENSPGTSAKVNINYKKCVAGGILFNKIG